MADLVNMVMLVGASAGSLAFGVLAAYGVVRAAFSMMRPHDERPTAVEAQPEVAQIS